MTREGWQFCFMIGFIVLGAVIRDVNLLVILAGTLLAMLLIQWRVCVKSLQGLTVYRRLPRSIQARKEFEIELTVANPKRWLGVWWGIAQDRLLYISPRSTEPQVSQSISILFPSIPPNASRSESYRCSVERRGEYRFLGTDITTRFPLGLMRAILNLPSSDTFIAQPPLGRLHAGWRELFQGKVSGIRQRASRALSDQGEFFGLRAYHAGDSPRWIHWRSSARTDELMVKQFQRADNQELVLVLDLFRPKSGSQESSIASEDLAVEFVATVAGAISASNSAILTLAIADSHPTIASKIQTRGQNGALLDRLAIATPGEEDGLPAALELLEQEYRLVRNLVVISTRGKEEILTSGIRSEKNDRTIQFWNQLVWLNASNRDLAPFFEQAGGMRLET